MHEKVNKLAARLDFLAAGEEALVAVRDAGEQSLDLRLPQACGLGKLPLDLGEALEECLHRRDLAYQRIKGIPQLVAHSGVD